MIVNASSESPRVQPQLYRTASISTIVQAEQQDRFLQLGELNDLVTFLNSGTKRLEIAEVLSKNADILVAKAADKIFVGGSAISYLERPQASFVEFDNISMTQKEMSGNVQVNLLSNTSSNVISNDTLPPGFKPINVVRYGSTRMKKSLRDLDWFLRYLTYAIIAGDPNILSVNIRGLKDLISNACSSAAATVALREMRKSAISIFDNDLSAQEIVQQYFNILITEFDSPSLTDKIRRRTSTDVQGLRLPQIYSKSGIPLQRFVMKTSLSNEEKSSVLKACYRQVFERDIAKAYNLSFVDLESQVKNGSLSIKEFIRRIGKSSVYRKQFYEPFVNSRVVELAFKHFLGRGLSSLEEFQKYFSILSLRGLNGLIDALINSLEYADYFAEETCPYLRGLSEEPLESRNWGVQFSLLNYSAPFRKVPQFITLFSDYKMSLPDQHPYGLGNDHLALQFGAIFPNSLTALSNKSAFFGRYTRRILLRQGPGIYSQISNPQARSKSIGSLGPKIFKLNSIDNTYFSDEVMSLPPDIEQIIKAIYLRVFGRFIYLEELSSVRKFESLFRSSKISVRDFIRNLVKSSVFRSLYWEPLYICKAIEYIHYRLLGRPSYGRQEINQYFDIVYREGYYKMIDYLLNSSEYIRSFGDNTVPYERYITSANMILKSNYSNFLYSTLKTKNSNSKKFIELSNILEKRSLNSIQARISQGVSTVRDQYKVFQLTQLSSQVDKRQVVKAIYRQIFERDLNSFAIGDEFINLEKALVNNNITVQQFIEQIGSSSLYGREFYQPYPNTKVIELGTKHFLGRAPNNQAEIRYYNQILASQGLSSFITVLVNSNEYNQVFGVNIVPYRRFTTLPAANFPNTEKLYNTLTKQSSEIIVPSFIVVPGNQ
uniref:Phycobiliprotein ApcE n=1 Tax=Aglaothamnion neglectum TaxID=2765 RepID=APCE_AGLNE|nr:RecName: Full=Phycobiliprotein ApcE; AltName: Full=Anchor polypeptide; AltName: Full=PBS-anchor protein; AltName: Full=Phycobilisome linker polypeptide [Aglaothamnion neglectum]CAA77957.1 anchor polypeptide [Aglaothamnion neglectum]